MILTFKMMKCKIIIDASCSGEVCIDLHSNKNTYLIREYIEIWVILN